MQIYMYTYIYAYIYDYIHMYIYICIYTHMYGFTSVSWGMSILNFIDICWNLHEAHVYESIKQGARDGVEVSRKHLTQRFPRVF